MYTERLTVHSNKWPQWRLQYERPIGTTAQNTNPDLRLLVEIQLPQLLQGYSDIDAIVVYKLEPREIGRAHTRLQF